MEYLLGEIKTALSQPPQIAAPDEPLTRKRGAEFYGVTEPTFDLWEKRGYFQRRYIAGEPRYLRSELLAALKRPELKRAVRRKSSTKTPAAQ